MTGTMGLIVGFAVAAVTLSGVTALVVRRVRASTAAELERQKEVVSELRRERADDKETNRRLRHELHTTRSAQPSVDDRYAPAADLDADTAYMEREDALRTLAETRRQLESVRARLADREAKLRDYRDALKEIRLSLEAQDRLTRLVTITDDVTPIRSSSDVVEPVAERMAE